MAVPGAYFLRKKGGDSPLVIILFTESGCTRLPAASSLTLSASRRRSARHREDPGGPSPLHRPNDSQRVERQESGRFLERAGAENE